MDGEKNSSINIIMIVMAVIVVIAIFVGGALYVKSLPGGDKSGKETEEITEEVQEEFSNIITEGDDSVESKIDTDVIRSLLLRYSDKENDINFRYEFYVSGGSMFFSGMYSMSGKEASCYDQKISTSRLKDVTEILERYIVASKIQEMINDSEMQYHVEDEIGALEISFTDGRHASFGYPNGAGNAVAKYCKSLTEWLAGVNNKE